MSETYQQNIEENSFKNESDTKNSFSVSNDSTCADTLQISHTVVPGHQQETTGKPKAPIHQSSPLKVSLLIASMLVTSLLLVQCSPSIAATPYINWQDSFALRHGDNTHLFNRGILFGILFRDTGQIRVIIRTENGRIVTVIAQHDFRRWNHPTVDDSNDRDKTEERENSNGSRSANNATSQSRDNLAASGRRMDSRVTTGLPTNENVSNQNTDTENIDRFEDCREGEIRKDTHANISRGGDRCDNRLVISNHPFFSQGSRLINTQYVNELNESTENNTRNTSSDGFGVLVISGQSHRDDRNASTNNGAVPINFSDNNQRRIEQVEIPSEETANSPSELVITGQTFVASERESIAITNTPVPFADNELCDITLSEDTSNTPGALVITGQEFQTSEREEIERVDIPVYNTSNNIGVLVITGQTLHASAREGICITDLVTQGQTSTTVPTETLVNERNVTAVEDTSNSPGELVITRQYRRPGEHGNITMTENVMEGQTNNMTDLYNTTVDSNIAGSDMDIYQRVGSAHQDLVTTLTSDNNQRCDTIPNEDTSNIRGVLVITGQEFLISEGEENQRAYHRTPVNTAVGLYRPSVSYNHICPMDNYDVIPSPASDNNQHIEDTGNVPDVLVITGQECLNSVRDSIIPDLVTQDQTNTALGLNHPSDEINEALNEQHGELVITDHTRQPNFATAGHQLLVTDHTNVMDLQCPSNQRAAVNVGEIAVSGQHQLPNLIIPQVYSNSMIVDSNGNQPFAPRNNETEISN